MDKYKVLNKQLCDRCQTYKTMRGFCIGERCSNICNKCWKKMPYRMGNEIPEEERDEIIRQGIDKQKKT